jgi:hypothetical protein
LGHCDGTTHICLAVVKNCMFDQKNNSRKLVFNVQSIAPLIRYIYNQLTFLRNMKQFISDKVAKSPLFESAKKLSNFNKVKRFSVPEYEHQDAAFFIRIGMGLLFMIGRCSKLSQLLSPDHAEGLVNSHVGTSGYSNLRRLRFATITLPLS